MSLYWPIGLIVLSNVVYHICAKSTPEAIDPFASLAVTYLIGAVFCVGLYYVFNRGSNILQEYASSNWTMIVLGLAIVGLEAGSLYMYKVGWNINTGSLLSSAILAIALVVVGFLLYHESITWSKVLGVAICMVGIYFLNN